MNKFKERFAEMHVTEWRGVRVRVTLELPNKASSMTSQMVLDERDLHILQGLKKPKNIELLSDVEASLALTEWDIRRKEAQRVVDIISNKIALDITRAIGQ